MKYTTFGKMKAVMDKYPIFITEKEKIICTTPSCAIKKGFEAAGYDVVVNVKEKSKNAYIVTVKFNNGHSDEFIINKAKKLENIFNVAFDYALHTYRLREKLNKTDMLEKVNEKAKLLKGE